MTPDESSVDRTTDLSGVAASGRGGLPLASNAERYELLREIARGGMGEVFRARDRLLNRDVAVKMLLKRFEAESPIAARFFDEARLTGRLQHPAIPPVHDVGVLPDGRPFLAMKLIEGRTLADELAARASPDADRGRFLAAFEQVSQGVAYAHSNGILHRDLKPSNIMVGAFGEVQVMDWGLAKNLTGAVAAAPDSTEDESDRTEFGSMVGTPAFMPPEQARGELDHIDERVDVFGLGAILCVILTGRPPYVAATFEAVCDLATRGDLTETNERLKSCSWESEVVDLCMRCLSPVQERRPRDAGVVAAEVAAIRAAAEARAREAELSRVRAEGEREKAAAEAREQRKRRRVQLVLAGTLLVLFAGAGAAAWWSQKQQAKLEADAIKRQVENDRLAQEKESRESRNAEAIDVLLARAEAALRDREDVDEAEPLLAEATRRSAEGIGAAPATRLGRAQTDLAWLRECEACARFRIESVGARDPTFSTIAECYRQCGESLGLVESLSPSDFTARIASSWVRNRVLATLDVWLVYEKDSAIRKRLGDWLVAADPEPYRDAVRHAFVSGNSARVQELAKFADALQQPARFGLAMGLVAQIDINRRTQILASVCRARPNDFGSLVSAGIFYQQRASFILGKFGRSDGQHAVALAEAMSWYQAALAVRPNNGLAWALHGMILVLRGEASNAAESARNAIRLEPELAYGHFVEGAAFKFTGSLENAARSLERATSLNKSFAGAYFELGAVYELQGRREKALQSYREALRLAPTHDEFIREVNRLSGVVSPSTVEADLAALQGEWQATFLDAVGRPTHRARKTISGSTESIQFLRLDGTLISRNEFTIRLELRGTDRLYHYTKGRGLDGVTKGCTLADGSYAYRIQGDAWTELQPAKPLVWRRVHVAPPPRETH